MDPTDWHYAHLGMLCTRAKTDAWRLLSAASASTISAASAGCGGPPSRWGASLSGGSGGVSGGGLSLTRGSGQSYCLLLAGWAEERYPCQLCSHPLRLQFCLADWVIASINLRFAT